MKLLVFTSSPAFSIKKVMGDIIASASIAHAVAPFPSMLPSLEAGEVALLCGDKGLKLCQAHNLIPKNRTINSMRNVPIPYQKGHIVLSYDPRYALERDYSRLSDIKWDTQLAIRVAKTGKAEVPPGHYLWVDDFEDTINSITSIYQSTGFKVEVALDLETVSTNEYDPKAFIVMISVTYEEGMANAIRFSGLHDQPAKGFDDDSLSSRQWEQINWLLNSDMISMRGANFKFDLRWIREKWGITCSNFKFDTLLVGSLLDENRSNNLNTHAKVYTDMGGYDDCVAPDTRVCTADLRWVPISQVEPGDMLLGFDEECKDSKRRVMRLSKAVSTKKVMKPGYRVTFSNGVVVECSDNHGWLAHEYKGNGPFKWVHTRDLKVGVRVQQVLPVRSQLCSWESGYIAGLYDGEGYVSYAKAGIISGISQKPGIVWDTYERIMQDLGFGGYYARSKNTDGVKTSKHSGGVTLELLQVFRPERLIQKFPWDGKVVPSGVAKVYVSKVEALGHLIECVSLETTTHTFVAEGIASHNSFNKKYDKGKMHLIPSPDLLLYGGGDTDACLKVSKVMKEELVQDRALTRFYVNLLHPASRAFEDLEREGVLVDQNYFMNPEIEFETNDEGKPVLTQGLKAYLAESIAEAETKAFSCMSHRIRNKYRDNLSLTRSAILKEFMFGPLGLHLKPTLFTDKVNEAMKADKTFKPSWEDASTAHKHLVTFSDVPEAKEFIDALKDYNSACKTLSTYVDGFMACLRSDGRFHPSYFLFKGGYEIGEGGTNCMTAETLVPTQRGVLPVVDVRVGDLVLTHAGVWRPVAAWMDNGVKGCWRITTEAGHSLTVTGNHKIETLDGGWVRADELEVGTWCNIHSAPEEWKGIPEWPYEISSWGRVRRHSNETGRIQTPQPKGRWGHLKVCLVRGDRLRKSGNRKDFSVHRLVATAFVQNPHSHPEVCHRDGRAWNNVKENLCWGTSQDNGHDREVHGILIRARKEKQAKLDWAKVEFIRSSTLNNVELSAMFGVSRELVRDVRLGKKWNKSEPPEFTSSFMSSEIVSVEYVGELHTYGLTVEEHHTHVTGGIVTHNTGRTSATDPAVQCLEGTMRVLTNKGWLPIRELVEGYEQGNPYTVVTHTGKEKPVIGVYRNGVKSVLTLSFEHGKVVTSTGNHPYLTDRGWVRADELKEGDTCYALKGKWFRSSDTELYKPDLPQLGVDEEQVQQPDLQRLRELRRQGYQAVRALAPVPELFGRHGGETGEGLLDRPYRQQRGLHAGELPMVECEEASLKPQEHEVDNLQGQNSDRGGMGEGLRHQQGKTPLSTDRFGVEYGRSLDEGDLLECGVYEACKIESITPDGQCETFDITVQDSHSFVAEGIVVHNTIPKHTKWAKMLRRGYIAPPGYVIINWDYSQGELRVAACIANEKIMIEAYKIGLDLHMITGGRLNGYDLDDMLAMKDAAEHDPDAKKLFKYLRQGGKAGNFGLLYGMSAHGFQVYAKTTYGVDLTDAQATQQRDSFFQLYPALTTWHDNSKAMGHHHEMVRSPLGRIRHLPLINSPDHKEKSAWERYAINSPVQGTLSDLGMLALAEFKLRYGDTPGCRPFMFTHDAITAYVKEDEAPAWYARMKDIMENLPLKEKFGWEPQLTFTTDAEIGYNLADMIEGYTG